MEYYSQSGQDKFIDECVFQEKEGGFFVDIGAHDGVTFSNTYMLEKTRGWHGICIEPVPDIFKKCEKNRASQCIQGCIASNPGVRQFAVAKGVEMLSGLTDSMTREHLKRLNRENAEIEHIDVQCYNFNALMESYKVTRIDYCSIDTEGVEYDILKTIDLNKYRPTCFTIEENGHWFKIWVHMKKHHYVLIEKLEGDLFFVEKDFARLMPKVGFLKKREFAKRIVKSMCHRLSTKLRFLQRSF
jgi:FkbM family methyltransferase